MRAMKAALAMKAIKAKTLGEEMMMNQMKAMMTKAMMSLMMGLRICVKLNQS